MDFQGKAVLVYLEEDNIARAYFRIQPLLTEEGSVAAQAGAEFPDDGFLRIVPDKNEQHTFKERMRSMCGLCLLDLRFLPPEANKIRTNKNYSPVRGETNQFIVYSDAVHAMPENLFFQVVSEENVSAAHTPQVYIRKGANIQGPFQRSDGQPVGETMQLPPDRTAMKSTPFLWLVMNYCSIGPVNLPCLPPRLLRLPLRQFRLQRQTKAHLLPQKPFLRSKRPTIRFRP